MLYRFEVIQTVDGLPDPMAYPEEFAPLGNSYKGASMEVIMDFPDEQTARAQAVEHENGQRSEVWQKYCPSLFKGSGSIGGLDVQFLGLATDTDASRVKLLHNNYGATS